MTVHSEFDSLGGPRPRRKSVQVDIGGVAVGGNAPVVVQSMTNTDTADIDSTVQQVAALARAGSELVRITVDRDEAAAAVPHIHEKLLKRGVNVPLVQTYADGSTTTLLFELDVRIRRPSGSDFHVFVASK